jgi:hypothetical protein
MICLGEDCFTLILCSDGAFVHARQSALPLSYNPSPGKRFGNILRKLQDVFWDYIIIMVLESRQFYFNLFYQTKFPKAFF